MKKAMVYGAGMSGKGAKELLESQGYMVYLVDDKIGMSSSEALNHIGEISIFVKSPGVPYTKLVQKVIENEIEVIDELELAYREMVKIDNRPEIIAVTGTNGKTTVTTKIKELIEFSGKKAMFAGNIGVSFAKLVLDLKAGNNLDYVVIEMSSYQLENLDTFKADIALVLNLAPDHLDRYDSVSSYYDTKLNIGMNQTKDDVFIVNLDSKELMSRIDEISGTQITISIKNKTADVHVVNSKVITENQEAADSNKFKLKGIHNLENQLFIVAVARLLEIEFNDIREFLYNTETLDHRMEEFYSVGETLFVNDSKGTNLESTIMALGAYSEPTVILGGVDKKLSLESFVEDVMKVAKEVYLIGEIADDLEKLFVEKGYPIEKLHNLKTLENVVLKLKKTIVIDEKNTVLFSPATASFDQFKNYIERGNVFKELIKKHF